MKKGADNPMWRGGRHQVAHGYFAVVVANDDPLAVMGWKRGRPGYKRTYVLEHRLVMARYLGRVLGRSEQVHHINGDRSDNRIENLQLRNGPHGSGQAWCCAECGSSNVVPVELKGS